MLGCSILVVSSRSPHGCRYDTQGQGNQRRSLAPISKESNKRNDRTRDRTERDAEREPSRDEEEDAEPDVAPHEEAFV